MPRLLSQNNQGSGCGDLGSSRRIIHGSGWGDLGSCDEDFQGSGYGPAGPSSRKLSM